MAEFDMSFVEAGQANFATMTDSQTQVQSAAGNEQGNAVGTSNGELGGGTPGGGTVEIGPIEIGPGEP
jgi:hypothetical protein